MPNVAGMEAERLRTESAVLREKKVASQAGEPRSGYCSFLVSNAEVFLEVPYSQAGFSQPAPFSSQHSQPNCSLFFMLPEFFKIRGQIDPNRLFWMVFFFLAFKI